MTIEKEMRFFKPHKKFKQLIDDISNNSDYSHSYYEMTVMYDNPNPKYSFYDAKIDGRLRLRYSEIISAPFDLKNNSNEKSRCLVTWKRRLPNGRKGSIRKEEEIEYCLEYNQSENVRKIFEDVLKCKKMSSYERRRHIFCSDIAEITIDEFPYGIMVEFELKGDNSSDSDLLKLAKETGFSSNSASKLSCDDMYRKLCKDNSLTQNEDILFSDKNMPKIR